jgi:lysyl-tRNA synthetase class 2
LTLEETARYTAARRRKEDLRLPFEPLDQYLQRQKKLKQIEALGCDPFPHSFPSTRTVAEIVEGYASKSSAELEADPVRVRVAGRIVALRLHGKAGFAHILGQGKRLQIYLKLDAVGERAFQLFQLLDLGDVVGVAGHLFRTKTNELTVWVEELVLLAKALLPLPEKWHGLADVELRYRQRYLDLIVNEGVRRIFQKRAHIIHELRSFFDARGFLEVETPMMHPIVGGATARPFATHHNALDLHLSLRIAPELYLKRLVIGGFDRVYEINRNFRNEGLSAFHKPEFTMLEFYQAFSDYRSLMDLTEELFTCLAQKICGGLQIRYAEHGVDFSRWQRLSMREAIGKYWPVEAGPPPAAEQLAAPGGPRALAGRYTEWAHRKGLASVSADSALSDGLLTALLFEAIAQDHLIPPTLIYDFPADLSPLAKRRDDDPSLAERFEVFAGGLELGNGYSELNDPDEQERRFREQIARGGEEVPKELDTDYLRALCHAMPPTAGMGLGIDRLTMLLTDSRSIREVILFPLLRPEAPARVGESGASENR